MTVSSFEGKRPRIGEGTYIHPSADVFGDVTIGKGCWIGPGARIRGDYCTILIGDYTSVEDNCVIHGRPGETTTIGSWVTLGHGCIVHTATMVNDYAIVGMRAVISDWTTVGEWAVVGEGAVVKQRQEIPAEHIAVGIPAKVLDKKVDDEYKQVWMHFKRTYVDLASRYQSGLVTLE